MKQTCKNKGWNDNNWWKYNNKWNTENSLIKMLVLGTDDKR